MSLIKSVLQPCRDYTMTGGDVHVYAPHHVRWTNIVSTMHAHLHQTVYTLKRDKPLKAM